MWNVCISWLSVPRNTSTTQNLAWSNKTPYPPLPDPSQSHILKAAMPNLYIPWHSVSPHYPPKPAFSETNKSAGELTTPHPDQSQTHILKAATLNIYISWYSVPSQLSMTMNIKHLVHLQLPPQTLLKLIY